MRPRSAADRALLVWRIAAAWACLWATYLIYRWAADGGEAAYLVMAGGMFLQASNVLTLRRNHAGLAVVLVGAVLLWVL